MYCGESDNYFKLFIDHKILVILFLSLRNNSFVPYFILFWTWVGDVFVNIVIPSVRTSFLLNDLKTWFYTFVFLGPYTSLYMTAFLTPVCVCSSVHLLYIYLLYYVSLILTSLFACLYTCLYSFVFFSVYICHETSLRTSMLAALCNCTCMSLCAFRSNAFIRISMCLVCSFACLVLSVIGDPYTSLYMHLCLWHHTSVSLCLRLYYFTIHIFSMCT